VIRGVIAAVLTLIVLAVDFVIFPDLVEDSIQAETVVASDVVNGKLITLGKFHLHTLRVSYGRLIEDDYIARLGPATNGVAVTAYASNATVAVGGLSDSGRFILSTQDTKRLFDLIQEAPTAALGSVLVFHPDKTERESLSKMETLFVLRSKRGADREAKDAMKTGLVALLNQAGKEKISGLLLPALPVGPMEKDTLTFDEFYQYLFDALAKTTTPHLIDLTLFEGWSSADLESAITAINAHWGAHLRERTGNFPTIHRMQLRLVLIGLVICFIVSSFHTVLGLKSTAILTTGFALSLLGSFKTVETVVEGLGSDIQNIALIALTIILAVGFPYFVNWSVKDLFKQASNGGH
jgi:hypothetical protein